MNIYGITRKTNISCPDCGTLLDSRKHGTGWYMKCWRCDHRYYLPAVLVRVPPSLKRKLPDAVCFTWSEWQRALSIAGSDTPPDGEDEME